MTINSNINIVPSVIFLLCCIFVYLTNHYCVCVDISSVHSRTSLSSYDSINNDVHSLNNYSFDVNFHSDLTLSYLNLFKRCNGIYYFFIHMSKNNNCTHIIDYMYMHIYLLGENDVEYAELSQLQNTDATGNSNPVPGAGFPKSQGKKDNRWQSKNPTSSATTNQIGLSNEVLFLSVFNKNGWICPMQLPPKGTHSP